MSMSLSVADWLTIVQLIYRINCVEDYDDFPKQVLGFLNLVLDYSIGILCITYPNESALTVKEIHTENVPDEDIQILKEQLETCPFITGLCLDLSGPVSRGPVLSHFKNQEQMRNIVIDDLQRALSIVLYHKEYLLGYIILWRKSDIENFNTRDMCVLGTLRNHISLQLYKLLQKSSKTMDGKFELERALLKYELSKRELEVLYYICEGYSDTQICETLFVSTSTFKKHLNHIYEKMKVNNRIRLIKLVEREKKSDK